MKKLVIRTPDITTQISELPGTPIGVCYGCGKTLTPWKSYDSNAPEEKLWKGYPTISRAYFHSLRCASLFAECAVRSGFRVEIEKKQRRTK